MEYRPRGFSEPSLFTHDQSHGTVTPSIYSTHEQQTDADSIAPGNLDSRSILSTTEIANKYGFPSEEAYLTALRGWVMSQSFVRPDPKCNLPGFYGRKTVDDLIREHREGASKKDTIRPSKKSSATETQRSKEDDQLSLISQKDGDAQLGVRTKARRKNSLGQWLARRRTLGSISITSRPIQEDVFPAVPVREPAVPQESRVIVAAS